MSALELIQLTRKVEELEALVETHSQAAEEYMELYRSAKAQLGQIKNEYVKVGHERDFVAAQLEVAKVALGKIASHKQTSTDKGYLIAQCEGYTTVAREALAKLEGLPKGDKTHPIGVGNSH